MHFGGPWLPWPPLDMVTWRMQIYTIINLTFLIVLQLLFRFLLLILFPFWNFLFSLIVITSFLVRLMCVLIAPIKVVVYFNRFSQYLSICFLWKPHTNHTKRKKKKKQNTEYKQIYCLKRMISRLNCLNLFRCATYVTCCSFSLNFLNIYRWAIVLFHFIAFHYVAFLSWLPAEKKLTDICLFLWPFTTYLSILLSIKALLYLPK